MATKAKPPMQTLTPAVGPNPDGLTHQALGAAAPDPARPARRTPARSRAARKATRPAAKRSAATDEGADTKETD